MRNNCFSTKIFFVDTGVPPGIFLHHFIYFFVDVGNSIKRDGNMKYWKTKSKIFFFSIFKKFIKKIKQHYINIKNYTAHPHEMVHAPAKFWEHISIQCFFELQCENEKLNVTDGQTDGRMDRWTDRGRCDISRPRAYGAAGDKNIKA